MYSGKRQIEKKKENKKKERKNKKGIQFFLFVKNVTEYKNGWGRVGNNNDALNWSEGKSISKRKEVVNHRQEGGGEEKAIRFSI